MAVADLMGELIDSTQQEAIGWLSMVVERDLKRSMALSSAFRGMNGVAAGIRKRLVVMTTQLRISPGYSAHPADRTAVSEFPAGTGDGSLIHCRLMR